MNQARKRTGTKKVLSMILVLVMLLSLLSMAAFTLPTAASSDSAASNDDSFYRIVHLDCGRKYFTKDWIIALLNEMKADGYNQLQLAFGNDGLRFLLDDMSFTANGTKYLHETVVSKVEAGNMAQNSSGDKRWLTQSDMDEIIATAQTLGIEIVPLLNLPGHANAILDIANDTYNASGSNNTLDVANSEAARNFGMAIFQKYVDYFASKGCKFFSFGADEYANDAKGTFSFSRLDSTQYSSFVSFINNLSAYIKSKSMTPRAFNDGLYYNGQSASIDTKIQCCYWSSGWGSYPVAAADTIDGKGHAMINTNGEYYYVLGKNDNFDNGYSYASGFDNSAFAGNKKISNPIGSMFCIWSDFPNAETETQVAQNVRLVMRAMALRMNDQSIDGMDTSVVANGFKADGKLNTGSTVTPDTNTSTKDIYVAVNGTTTEPVTGDLSGTYTTANPDIATVTAKATTTEKELKEVTSIESGKQYLIVNNRRDENKRGNLLTTQTSKWEGHSGLKLTGEASTTSTELWTIQASGSGYEVMRSGKYLTIGVNTASVQSSSAVLTLSYNTSDGYWNISQNSCYLNNLGNSETAGGWNNSAAPTDDGSKWTIYEITGGKQTTITFNGVAVGTTSVEIGGVTYTIHVTAEDLKNVTPLTIEYWITNGRVKKDANSSTTAASVSAKDNGIATETGKNVSELVPPKGIKVDGGREVDYWRCRMLNTKLENSSTSGTEQQTEAGGDDETVSGIGFTKIRYYGGNWQVFTENNAWVTVDTVKNQLVAYYLENIKVSDEVDSFAADWGNRGDGTNGGWLDANNYCTLSMQVVYEDGTTNPTGTAADDLKTKTIVYGYWYNNNGRGIGTVLLQGQEYEIYKVTSETGEATASISSNNNNTYSAKVTNFTWDKNEKTVWEGDPSSSVSIHNNANEFSSEGVNANLCWDENKEAILLRVYVRAKVTEDSLTVNYFDESNTSLPFYSYNIAVASGTTFSNQFAYVPGNANENGSLSNNTVVNIKGVTQTVNWQLEKMSEIGAQYRFGNYIFTNATKETGNKVVNLYYKFNSEKTFVVDFGLPLHITMTDISPLLNQANVEGVAVGNSLYATVRANDDFSIDYILNKTIDGSDRITVTYTGTKVSGESDSATYNLTIIPATSVYYEDSFASFTNANGTKNVAQVDNGDKGIWTKVTDGTTQTNVNQALEALGSKENVYGYDGAYTNCNTFSMGSATKVTVNAKTADNGQWPTATFTFRGTGFDVISLTNSDAGTVVYTVTNKTTGKSESHFINNYYGYVYEDGQWVVKNNDTKAPYQVPVIKVSGLDYDTYEVKISVVYGAGFDKTGDDQYSFWLDAIRVYDPAGSTLNDKYARDGENAPNYVEIKKVILDTQALDKEGAVGAVFIDGKGSEGVTASDYANQGPNHEAYLAKDQAIAFQLIANGEPSSVQIGTKLANGTSANLLIKGANCDKAINGLLTLNTATDMYYKLTDLGWTRQTDGTYKSNVITLMNTSDDIVSLTNVKFIGATYSKALPSVKATEDEATVVAFAASAAMVDEAVSAVDSVLNPTPQVFAPSRFEASWSRNVRKGGTATLTVKASADVEAITVNGEKITAHTTKTARSVWGAKETYHVFTYRVTNAATADYTIYAFDAKGAVSDPITATLTVRPSIRDWWNGIFDKWKH